MSIARIVAPPPDAVATGAIVLKVGSNAVDAAMACVFAQTVVVLLINILSHNCRRLVEILAYAHPPYRLQFVDCANKSRCDPDQRYQDVGQALAALRPLAQDNRPPKDGLTMENKKNSSLFLTYTDKDQPTLNRLVDEFKANAWDLGADVNMTKD